MPTAYSENEDRVNGANHGNPTCLERIPRFGIASPAKRHLARMHRGVATC
jgi:hypothetical protein